MLDLISSLPVLQLGIESAALVLLLATLASHDNQKKRWEKAFREITPTFSLWDDPLLLRHFRQLASSLRELQSQTDPVFRDLLAAKLAAIGEELQILAEGKISFQGTETWRTAYEALLTTLDTKVYLSVAWVKSLDYWNDAPGRHSMQLNYQLIERGFRIERIHILPARLWPAGDEVPVPEILGWLEDQRQHGISVFVTRESELAGEPDLLRDFAIYGTRAAARQQTDDRSRTIRFVLAFDRQSLRQAREHWERLLLYAKSWQDPLDRRAAGGLK